MIQTHDARTLAAQFVGRDTSTDLAVLRVADLGLSAAAVATEPARVGQLVLAVGRSSGEGPMASAGIVSAIGGPLRTGRGTTLERYKGALLYSIMREALPCLRRYAELLVGCAFPRVRYPPGPFPLLPLF